MISSFNNKKKKCGVNFGKTNKKFVKVQDSSIRLNDRSNIQHQGIDK